MPDADTTIHTRHRREERRVVAQRGRSAPDDERSLAVIVIGAIRGVFAPTAKIQPPSLVGSILSKSLGFADDDDDCLDGEWR